MPDYHRVTINRTERNAYIPFGKLAGLEYVYSFLAFSASVTSKKEIKQHEKRTGYFNNKQQSDGGERHEEQIHSLKKEIRSGIIRSTYGSDAC